LFEPTAISHLIITTFTTEGQNRRWWGIEVFGGIM
jgi:hypothetical protein